MYLLINQLSELYLQVQIIKTISFPSQLQKRIQCYLQNLARERFSWAERTYEQKASHYKDNILSSNMTQPIHCLQTKRHKLSLTLAKNTYKRHLFARGYLVGQFYQYVPIESEQEVTFTGDFAGFLQPDFESDLYSLSYFFQGRIDNLCVLEIEEDEHSEMSKLMDQNMFIGYFRGVFEQREIYSMRQVGPAAFKHDVRKELQLLGIFEQSKQYELILPTFTRFLVKNLTAINLEKSVAEILGTMTIQMQVLPQLFDIFRYQKNSKEVLVIALNKENSLALPLQEGSIISSNSQITCTFDQQACLIKYVIRKIFQTEIDNSYGQFFSPFSLTYLNIVMTFLELKLHNPFVEDQYIFINFLNLDLDDKLDNNPYSSFNELFSQQDRNERLKNRMTKIDLFNSIESGQYIISTNYLTLFSYHSRSFENSNKKRSSRRWSLAIAKKNKYLKQPTVMSIRESYKWLKEKQSEQKKNEKQTIHLFHFSYWKHIHIQIPVYKYWVLNVIQIFVPIFILSSLSLFVFIQQNGVKVDGSSTLNARIINVAAILLAYVALIPMIKENAPRATNLSFIYIVIYLSIIPHILALLSSLRDRGMINTDWEERYHPFRDPLFVGSFFLLCFLIAAVLIVVFAFVRFSYSDYQIQLKPKSIPHKEFRAAEEPWGLRSYISRLKEKRKEQFNFNRADSLEELGFSMDTLE